MSLNPYEIIVRLILDDKIWYRQSTVNVLISIEASVLNKIKQKYKIKIQNVFPIAEQ